MNEVPSPQGLYDPAFEHDACGVGFVVDMHGRASHRIIDLGIASLCHLDHRGATGAEANVGDGSGFGRNALSTLNVATRKVLGDTGRRDSKLYRKNLRGRGKCCQRWFRDRGLHRTRATS